MPAMPGRLTRHALALSLILALGAAGLPAEAAGKKPAKSATRQEKPKKQDGKQAPPQTEASEDGGDVKKPGRAIAAPRLVLDEAQVATIHPDTRAALDKLSTALHEEDRAVALEFDDSQEQALKDIAMLWQAAVERSASIRFAIEKLSRQDETGKPVKNDGFGKKVLQSTTRLAGVASAMVTANPAGLIGSSVIEDALLGSGPDPNLQRVTDADMVILAKEVEALQTKVIAQYYQYRNAEARWKLAQEAAQTLNRYASNPPDGKAPDAAIETIITSLYEGARQDELETKQAYVSARNELGMLVGAEAVKAMETADQQKSRQQGES